MKWFSFLIIFFSLDAAQPLQTQFYQMSRPITQSQLASGTQTLAVAGRYYFTESLQVPNVSNTSLLHVTNSGVFIDLQGKSLICSTGALGSHGIEIAAGLHNVTIMNGTIANCTGAGIYIHPSCTGIKIYNITVTQTTGPGIVLAGVADQEPISNCQIVQCSCISSGVGADGAVHGLQATYCNNLMCQSLLSSGQKSPSASVRSVLLKNCNDCRLEQCFAADCQGIGCSGFEFINCQAIIGIGLVASHNFSTTNPCYGIALSGTRDSKLLDSMFTDNRLGSAGKIAAGVFLELSRNIVIENCTINNNSGASYAAGIYSVASKNNVIKNVLLVSNSNDSTGEVCGICCLRESNSIIRNCFITANQATGDAYGIKLGDEDAANLCSFVITDNNQLYNNRGTVRSYGYRDFLVPTTNLFMRNIAFGQGQVLQYGQSTATLQDNMNFCSPSFFNNPAGAVRETNTVSLTELSIQNDYINTSIVNIENNP